MSDLLLFLRRFVSNPGRVGSIAPSSRFLCNRMMQCVPWEQSRVIVELGAGTGVFTREILRRKAPDAHFLAVERDPHFQRMLQERFPGLTLRDEAVRLPVYLKEMELSQADVIISGLPFAVFPEELRMEILDRVAESLAPDGLFVTFQYSLQLRNELRERFSAVQVYFTPWNLPPAFVYSCRNKRS